MRRLIAVAAFCLPLLAADLAAQGGAGAAPRREALERQLRQRLWRISQERVGLTDAQMTRLQAVARRYDTRRRALMTEERQQRAVLRAEITADARADQSRISSALDRLLQLQRSRVDLASEEQRDLAAFMSPLQRAKYTALQEQLRRRADALRRQRADSGAAPRRR